MKSLSDEKNNKADNTKYSKKFIALQTLIGLRFVNKKSIVYFRYTKDDKSERSFWEACLENSEVIRLKLNTTSKEIMNNFELFDFIQISQTNIVNLFYIHSIELKSRNCILNTPFQEVNMTISRANFNEIKSKFQID